MSITKEQLQQALKGFVMDEGTGVDGVHACYQLPAHAYWGILTAHFGLAWVMGLSKEKLATYSQNDGTFGVSIHEHLICPK